MNLIINLLLFHLCYCSERNRVRHVNACFSRLRQFVSSSGPNGRRHLGSINKRLSKVDTLRSAISYIRQLQQILMDQGENAERFQASNYPEVTIVDLEPRSKRQKIRCESGEEFETSSTETSYCLTSTLHHRKATANNNQQQQQQQQHQMLPMGNLSPCNSSNSGSTCVVPTGYPTPMMVPQTPLPYPTFSPPNMSHYQTTAISTNYTSNQQNVLNCQYPSNHVNHNANYYWHQTANYC